MRNKRSRVVLLLSILLLLVVSTSAQSMSPASAREREIAARFAPIFYQGIGEKRRSDLITNFDFDGDWRGDNNWANAEDARFPLRAYVYYAVSETATHYFVHYAVFHPQDYKGGRGGALLSEAIREGVRRGGKYDPTGLSQEAVLAHENDMEGCLVVIEKAGDNLESARVLFVETLAHDKFLKYATAEAAATGFERVTLEGQRPRLFIEPKGHGIHAMRDDEKQNPRGGTLVYSYKGRAEDPEQTEQTEIGYSLTALADTLWRHARPASEQTFGETYDYGTLTLNVAQSGGGTRAHQVALGKIGAAFFGKVGAVNAARPPWGWLDSSEREMKPGAWFFDPAQTVKRHFQPGDNFSTVYTRHPLLKASAPKAETTRKKRGQTQ